MTRRAFAILLALASLLAFAVAEVEPGTAGQGSVVAVLDTGVSPGPGIRPGVDLVDGDRDAADPNGHGTAVAASVLRTCPACTVLPVRVLSARGAAPWSRVAAGIVWAVDNGARVINISIAGPRGSARLRDAVAYATARNVRIVAAAGNTGDDVPQYPAAYRGVIAVAAAGSDWSARGAWVDLAVPGCANLPARLSGRAWACGTSFAAPVVAGVAASIGPEATLAALAAELPSLAPRIAVRVSGAPSPGRVLRAAAVGADTGRDQRLRWFRCPPDEGPHGCVPASVGATYRVLPSDRGATLVARLVTESFGGLWLASSARLPVS